MIDKNLLSLLACPETKKNLELADQKTIDRLNALIKQGKAWTKAKEKVTEGIDGGLLRVGDHKYMYPVRNGVPILLVEELIEIPESK